MLFTPIMNAQKASMHTLLLDIGNTRLKAALADQTQILYSANCANSSLTHSRLLDFLTPFLQDAKLQKIVCCSVVPSIAEKLTNVVRVRCPIAFINRDIKVPLATAYLTPETVGQDRMVAAYAARMLFAEPSLIVIDAGTAITLDLVLEEEFQGGFILASPEAQMRILGDAAQLPSLTLPNTIPDFAPGRSTTDCLTNGAIFGTCAMLDGLCSRLAQTYNMSPFIIGTGGLAPTLAQAGMHFTVLKEDLVLAGLHILAYQ